MLDIVIICRELLHTTKCGCSNIFVLLSEPVHDEFVQSVTKAPATSVDVERKPNQDKQFEKQKVLIVASASRNRILKPVPSVAGSS